MSRPLIKVMYKGNLLSLSKLSRKVGLSRETLRYRWLQGWRDEDLLQPPIIPHTVPVKLVLLKAEMNIKDAARARQVARERRCAKELAKREVLKAAIQQIVFV